MTGKYLLEIYGCQMNEADGELIAGLLEADGWQRVTRAEEADLIVVNTCAVRERASERVIGHIGGFRPLKRRHPGLRIAMVGCLARYQAEELTRRLPEVDFFLGPDAYRSLPELLRAESAPPHVATALDPAETYAGLHPARSAGVNAYVSIMRGCNRMCSYCMVPFARGRERSQPLAEVVEEARTIAGQGFRSLTLLGQTVTSYHDGESDFAALLAQLATIEGIARIRFLSPHPAEFTPRLLETLARETKVSRHLHLPLQSGSDRVLAAMRRGYTRGEYLALVARARDRLPGLAVTTDLIVGFPGERDEDFAETLDLMRAVVFDQAFMFAYSARPGTYAARRLADDVPEDLKRRRLEEMIELQESHARARYAAWIGQRVEVLVESPARAPQGHWFGRTDDFKDTIFSVPPGESLAPGRLVPVRVEAASSHTLKGALEAD
jgi:tRNA-2-methylthio-N6-dimethylallyladenosine synthase